ncbi:MAG: peptidoglycan-associated lipoprotein Pal [Bdellovibrionaceae bacterium]|nr:peptidoglycan-associated lipoprotein Pal [Pseudobdellovibrionaceae bacterium]MDW8189821.1 peptidoglycan-associated lipoprotein Pal [Pseudobdellovibrionaceae bacterium]
MKKFVVFLVTIHLVGLMGCASKKKEESTVPPTTASEVPISNEPIAFDSLGSDSGKIPGLNTVYFDFDKATLTSDTVAKLKENAQWMKNNPRVNIQIEGHCDSRGSIEYNLGLGERRAKAVRDFLVKQGVSKDRLSIVSYGKERPIAMGDSEEAHAKNRRANFVPLK